MLAALSPNVARKLALVPREALERHELGARTLSCGASIDEALPSGGLPRASVVEIASPSGLARATSVALAACASAQAEARLRGGDRTAGAWCAWIDSSRSLFAPHVARAGVDRDRLLVVAPPEDALARVAVRVAKSRVFSVVVVDAAAAFRSDDRVFTTTRASDWIVPVRRLALAVENTDTVVLLLTDLSARRSQPLPVAMRIELERPTDSVTLRVAKDRRGFVSSRPFALDLERAS